MVTPGHTSCWETTQIGMAKRRINHLGICTLLLQVVEVVVPQNHGIWLKPGPITGATLLPHRIIAHTETRFRLMEGFGVFLSPCAFSHRDDRGDIKKLKSLECLNVSANFGALLFNDALPL